MDKNHNLGHPKKLKLFFYFWLFFLLIFSIIIVICAFSLFSRCEEPVGEFCSRQWCSKQSHPGVFKTPIHQAAHKGSFQCLKMFVRHSPSALVVRDGSGKTPSNYSALGKNTACWKLLIASQFIHSRIAGFSLATHARIMDWCYKAKERVEYFRNGEDPIKHSILLRSTLGKGTISSTFVGNEIVVDGFDHGKLIKKCPCNHDDASRYPATLKKRHTRRSIQQNIYLIVSKNEEGLGHTSQRIKNHASHRDDNQRSKSINTIHSQSSVPRIDNSKRSKSINVPSGHLLTRAVNSSSIDHSNTNHSFTGVDSDDKGSKRGINSLAKFVEQDTKNINSGHDRWSSEMHESDAKSHLKINENNSIASTLVLPALPGIKTRKQQHQQKDCSQEIPIIQKSDDGDGTRNRQSDNFDYEVFVTSSPVINITEFQNHKEREKVREVIFNATGMTSHQLATECLEFGQTFTSKPWLRQFDIALATSRNRIQRGRPRTGIPKFPTW